MKVSTNIHYVPAYEDCSAYCGAEVVSGIRYSSKIYEVTCRSCLQQLVDDGEIAKLVLAKLYPPATVENMASLLKEHYK